jgi:prolipoprotein diacylglyceryltransferase
MLSYFPYVANINFFGYLIPSPIFFTMLGVVLMVGVLFWETKRQSLNFYTTILIYQAFFILSETFSRVIFIFSRVFFHHDFATQPKIYYFYTNQKIALGMYLGLIMGVLIGTYLTNKKNEVYKYLDMFLFGFLSLGVLSRLGGAMVHYQPGSITNSFWGVFYLGQYRHEPYLYVVISVTILLSLYLLYRKKVNIPGFFSLIAIAWVSLTRVITDSFRNNDLPLAASNQANSFQSSNYHIASWLTVNQIVYFAIFVVMTIVLIKFMKKHKDHLVKLLDSEKKPPRIADQLSR